MSRSVLRRPTQWVILTAVMFVLTGFAPGLFAAESQTRSSQPTPNSPANTTPAVTATGADTAESSPSLDAILKKYGGKSPNAAGPANQEGTTGEAAAGVTRDAEDLTKTMSAVKQKVQSQKAVRQRSSGPSVARQRPVEETESAIEDEQSSYSSTRSTGQPLGRMPNAVTPPVPVRIPTSSAARSSSPTVGQQPNKSWK